MGSKEEWEVRKRGEVRKREEESDVDEKRGEVRTREEGSDVRYLTRPGPKARRIFNRCRAPKCAPKRSVFELQNLLQHESKKRAP